MDEEPQIAAMNNTALIDPRIKERWRTRARRNTLSKLKSLLEFRELVEEYKAENVLMHAYKEAAEAMLCAPETLRDDMGKIREYPKEKLVYWLSNGLSFDHLETANKLAEAARKTPAKLLDQAIDPGNGSGDPMTVKELTAFACGELPQSTSYRTLKLVAEFERLKKVLYKQDWKPDKLARFDEWWSAGEEFRQ